MFPASANAGGQCQGAPDPCNTPQPPTGALVPMPYPNNAMVNQAEKTCEKVKFSNKPALNSGSEIPRSMGDEAGTGKGVMSGTNSDKMKYVTSSSKVKLCGKPGVFLTSMTAHNGANANAPTGAQIAPSQTKVLVAP